MMGVDEVIHSDPESSNKEQAMLAAANSGIDLSLPWKTNQIEQR